MESPWMTLEEAAIYIRRSVSYVKNEHRAMGLPSVERNGRRLTKREWLDFWIMCQDGKIPAKARVN